MEIFCAGQFKVKEFLMLLTSCTPLTHSKKTAGEWRGKGPVKEEGQRAAGAGFEECPESL